MFRGYNERMHLRFNMFDSPTLDANRMGFGQGLLEAGRLNPDVVGLCCDLVESTRMIDFAKTFPKRYFEIGVAEQNMAGIAAGLALGGKIPFMASYAAFSPGRNFDQVRVSIAYSQTNVKIIGAHGGISVGPDGATHQMLEDIALMRSLPGMVVIVPADAEQAHKVTLAAAKHKGPVYIRLAREPMPQVTTHHTPFEIGRANILIEGKDVTLISNGSLLYETLVAARQLQDFGIAVEVIDCHTVKPLDSLTILKSIRKTGAVVTAEEAQVNGGLGGAIAELIGERCPVPLERVGVNDSFGESGTADELMVEFGLKAKNIIQAAEKALKRKKK